MSTSITFQGPPTTQKNATLYQHALETIRFVDQARTTLEKLDNVDGVDLNSDPGTVVVNSARPVDAKYALAGALARPTLNTLKGQIVDGKMKADLSGSDYAATIVRYEETPADKIYSVEARPQQGYSYFPGSVRVSQNKVSGEIRLEQETEFPWALTFGPAAVAEERRFGPSGPTSVPDAQIFRAGEALRNFIDEEIKGLKSLDGGPGDLNPQAGVVVAAAYGKINSDNLVYGHMAGDYPIPTEASLHFDPQSGRVEEYTRGFADHESFSYHRLGDTQIYESQRFLDCNRLQINADGSRLQQHFQDAHMGKVDPQTYLHERTIQTDLLPRILDTATAVRTAGWSLLAGGTAGTLASMLTSGSIGVGVAVGLAAAVATAGLANSTRTRGVQLPAGINRFQGSTPQSRQANARMAYDHVTLTSNDKATRRQSWEMPAAGVSREKCIELLNKTDTGYDYQKLVILAQSLGEKGEPAVVVIPKDFHYPVRTADNGLVLPGGVTIPYSSIRAMSEWA